MDREAQRRLQGAIALLARDPRPPASRPLRGRPAFRVRVGDYRVIYTIDDDVLLAWWSQSATVARSTGIDGVKSISSAGRPGLRSHSSANLETRGAVQTGPVDSCVTGAGNAAFFVIWEAL